MRTFSTKQKVGAAVLGAGVIAAALGGAAYAYWSAGGSGDSTASTGTTSGITINGPSTAPSGLYPGIAPVTFGGTFTNSNPSKVYVQQVTITIENTDLSVWSAQADSGKPACTAADFTIVQPTPTNAEVVSGDVWSNASITMKDPATNQDNCKNVTVPLHYSSN